jgi:hypothetical protein
VEPIHKIIILGHLAQPHQKDNAPHKKDAGILPVPAVTVTKTE